MSRYDYFREITETDETLNDRQTYSNFNFFAKQFQGNVRQGKRYAEYRKYFEGRETKPTTKLTPIG